jgi:subtilase family serine protease
VDRIAVGGQQADQIVGERRVRGRSFPDFTHAMAGWSAAGTKRDWSVLLTNGRTEMRAGSCLSILSTVLWLLGLSVSVKAQSDLTTTAPFTTGTQSFSMSQHERGHATTPSSSLPQPRATSGSITARTHLRIVVPSAAQINFGSAQVQKQGLPPLSGYQFETPASLACIYDLVTIRVPGCNPNVVTTNPSGGSRAIAIVDAFDDPTAVSDLTTFALQFGLPAPNLTVVYANGTRPGLDPTGGWELEEALDTQWAFAMAPHARIFLVEAADNSLGNLMNAVSLASSLVAAAGGGEVSMSWGTSEFAGETGYDSRFTTPGVVYVASAGDSSDVEYPSASPNVISAGGTSISRDPNTGHFLSENTWQDSSGGLSKFETRPTFQNVVKQTVGKARGTPDWSFDANPNSGVWVFNSNPTFGTGWFVVGGTSVSAQALAGILNAAGAFNASSQAELQEVYNHMTNPKQFRDINYGNCGSNISDFAVSGYDLCTGIGSALGLKGK